MNSKISIGTALGILLFSCVVTYIIATTVALDSFNKNFSSPAELSERYKKLAEMKSYIDAYYYGDISEEKTAESIFKGYMTAFGSSAEYLSAEESKLADEWFSGIVVTAGFTTSKESGGYLLVSDVYRNSSAEKNGIKEGDLITVVDNHDVLSYGADNAVKLFSGSENTKLALKYRRNGVDYDVVLTREKTEIISVTGIKYNDCGYIRITSINSRSPSQLKDVLASLKSAGVKSYIIDVRDLGSETKNSPVNRVGSTRLTSAFSEILTEFMPAGAVLFGEYADGGTKTFLETLPNSNKDNGLPISVLVNSKTSGFGEAFASAFKTYRRAYIVGEKTAGSALLIGVYKLSDGSGLRFPTVKIKIGDDFDKVGIIPEFIVKNVTDFNPPKYADFVNSSLDPQLQKAIELLQ